MYIIELTYHAEPSEIEPLREAHMQWVKKYFNNGYFLASGRKDTLDGGIIFVKNIERHALDDIIAEDPFTKVADYQITGVNITSTQDNLQTLKA